MWIEKQVRLNPGEPVELYDFKADLGERNDVASRHPDVVRRIAAAMDSSRIDSPEFPVKTR